jgi:hypothetical protein
MMSVGTSSARPRPCSRSCTHVSRGTKKAVDDAIFEANNLGSIHRDFEVGLAYDLSVLDSPLSDSEVADLVARAADLAKDPTAIRAVRQVVVPAGGF